MSILLLLVGKSGSGKSEIAKHFPQLVAFTTREKRENEVDGVDYYFKDRSYIENEISKLKDSPDDFILEYGKYGNNYYGTLKSEFESKMNQYDVVVNTSEIEGALKLRNKFPDTVKLIWIDVFEYRRIERLEKRAKETGETREKLEERIREEYRDNEKKLCDYTIGNNNTIEETINSINRYVKLITNENKMKVLDSIKLLRKKIPNTDLVWQYYDLIITYDFYSNSKNTLSIREPILKIEKDLDFLNRIDTDDVLEINAINILKDYLIAVQTQLALNDD